MTDIDAAPIQDPAAVLWAVMQLWRQGDKNTFEIAMTLGLEEAEVAEIVHQSRERERSAVR